MAQRGTRPSNAATRLGRHWLFATALLLGVAVRVVVMVAYRPALVSPDSYSYLGTAEPFSFNPRRPVGYSLFLRPFVLLTDPRAPVVVVQHLAGLALAVACYAFLLRRGLPRWAATAAVLPLLLDPLQLVLEHYLLSDVLFEVLLVGACLLVLWRHRPGVVPVVVAGLAVGSAAVVRGAGDLLLAVFVVAMVCLRLRWWKTVAFVVAAALPLGAYVVGFHRQFGEYAVAADGPRFLYARVAPIVSCHDPELDLPSYERMLCPTQPVGQRPSTRYYMWANEVAPQYHVVPPPGMTQRQVVKDFDRRVVRAEPVNYARAVLKDLAGGFAPTRTYQVPGYLSSYWLFQDHFWSLDDFIARGSVSPQRLRHFSHDPGAARFMTAYRHWLYTPGPLMAALLLAAAAAVFGVRRARRSGDRVAVGLLGASCLLTLLVGAGVSGFSWRYQLPQIPLLPMAGALGLAAMLRGPAHPEAVGEPLRLLDRGAARLAALPLPRAARRYLRGTAESGRLQVALALLLGVVLAAAVAVLAVRSGWFSPTLAAVLGVVAGLAMLTALLVGHWRDGLTSNRTSVR